MLTEQDYMQIMVDAGEKFPNKIVQFAMALQNGADAAYQKAKTKAFIFEGALFGSLAHGKVSARQKEAVKNMLRMAEQEGINLSQNWELVVGDGDQKNADI